MYVWWGVSTGLPKKSRYSFWAAWKLSNLAQLAKNEAATGGLPKFDQKRLDATRQTEALPPQGIEETGL